MPYSSDKKKRQTSTDRSGKVTSMTSKGDKADDFVDPDESKINKGLGSLVKATEKQAEGVEKAKPDDKPAPTPTPEKAPNEGGENDDMPDAPAKPDRSKFPAGLGGEAAYQKAVREYHKKKTN